MESLIQNRDQLDEAVAAYEELNKRFPQGMFKPIADQQIERLQKKDALDFYTELAQNKPKAKVESPRSKLESLSLPENPPPQPGPAAPARSSGNAPGPALGIPEPSLKPTENVKPNAPKTEPPKPQTAKPDVSKTDVPKPDAVKPDAPKPDAVNPDAVKPDAVKPDAPKPDVVKPDAPKPDAPKPDAVKPDAPKTDSPKPEAPKKDK